MKKENENEKVQSKVEKTVEHKDKKDVTPEEKLNNIIKKAKEKGKITYGELASELDDANTEQIDKVFDAFEDMGVSVLKEDDLDLEEPDIDELEAVEDIKVEEWDKTKVLEIFDELRFNRYIERFKLKGKATGNQNVEIKHFDIVETSEIPNVTKLYYFLQTEEYDNTEFIIKMKNL